MFDQFLNDPRIGFENRLALEIAGFGGEFALCIHRRHHRQAVAHTDFVVLLAMAGRDMNGASALILGDKFTENDFGIAIDPGMAANDAFELGAGPSASVIS